MDPAGGEENCYFEGLILFDPHNSVEWFKNLGILQIEEHVGSKVVIASLDRYECKH